MRKTIKIWTAAAVLLAVLVPWAAFAASSSVSVSGGSAQVGKTVTVTVTYKGDSLGYVNGQMTYDNSKLEYLSGGSSQGDAGLVQLKSYADDASGKISFKVKFKAKNSGNVKLSLETLETQNLDGDQDMGSPSAGSTVKITAAATTEATKESTTQETTTEETTIQPATSPADETTGMDQDLTQQKDKEGSGINYPLLGILAVIIIALIAVIAKKLRGKKK
ncbi:hypothetical protein NE619_11290 [Anaerovorax odorimutans]|uniref:Cohesin domain-containing protein n=1 Tax=Anaerovorax odorimutans TaxID=109327 RepID=A0ABT1RQ36_9FIRM|nr:hypothetical protein [Anaerovorax odorimutans]MCQ4637308.1 hypothetical protein [Anaerovorax odorimutans]